MRPEEFFAWAVPFSLMAFAVLLIVRNKEIQHTTNHYFLVIFLLILAALIPFVGYATRTVLSFGDVFKIELEKTQEKLEASRQEVRQLDGENRKFAVKNSVLDER